MHRKAVDIKLYVYYFGDDTYTGGVLDRQRQSRPIYSNANGRVFFYGKTILIKQQYSNALVAINVSICKHDN